MKYSKEYLVDDAEMLDDFIGLAGVFEEDRVEYETEHISEMAFYNAVANSENIQDFFYTDEQLIKLIKELTETISNEMNQDWAVKESGRANVRRTIKRMLKMYKYPGNFNKTIQLVVKQAEHWDVIRENEGQRGA